MEKPLSFAMLDAEMGGRAPFLLTLEDGLEEELRVVVAPSEAGETGTGLPDFSGFDEETGRALEGILAGCRPIAPGNASYEIRFPEYLIYQVRDESYCAYAPEEVYRGKYLVVFEESKLLGYLREATDAQRLDDGTYYPAEWTHYGICAQNHVVDVVALCPPIIRRLEPGE